MMRGLLGLALALVALAGAHAQGTVQQAGPIVPGHGSVWGSNGVVLDGGTPQAPLANALGLYNGSSCPLGVSSQTNPGQELVLPYSQLQLCQTTATTTVYLQGFNGASTPGLIFDLGGTNYSFPGGPGAAPTRTEIATKTIGSTALIVSGYRTAGDLGAGALYSSNGCSSGGLQAIADASGAYYCLVLSGTAYTGWFGAYCDFDPTNPTGTHHDDVVALQAAAATGQSVVLNGGAATTQHCATSRMIDLHTANQGWTQQSADLYPDPTFNTDGFVLRFSGGGQLIPYVWVDAGAAYGMNVGAIENAAGNNLFKVLHTRHYGAKGGFTLTSASRVEQQDNIQWLQSDSQFATDANFTGSGMVINNIDSSFIGGSTHWGASNYLLGCGSGTEQISLIHPFNGRAANLSNPRLNPENLHDKGCGGGNLHILGMYDDNGQINIYGPSADLSKVWAFQQNTNSTYTNHSLINFYANGLAQHPSRHRLDVSTSTNIGTGNVFVSYLDNPNLVAITTATGNGDGTATAHVAAWLDDAPKPTGNGVVNVAGAGDLSCSTRCNVVSATATSVTYTLASGTPSDTVLTGTVQEVWADNYSALAGMQPDQGSYEVHTGSLKMIQEDPNQALFDIIGAFGGNTSTCQTVLQYRLADPSNPTGGPSEVCMGDQFLRFGVPPSNAGNLPFTMVFNGEANAACAIDNGLGGLTFGTGSACGNAHITFDSSGPIKPAADNGTSTGTSVNSWSAVWTYGLSLHGKGQYASATVPAAASGFGGATGRAFNGTTLDFRITIGNNGTDTGGVITMPFTANTHWDCLFSTFAPTSGQMLQRIDETADSTTTVTVVNSTTATGAAVAFTSGQVILARCGAY